jgi:phage FluMu protein Com
VQIRCYRCGWSFAIKKDEIAFALQALEQAGGGHHDVRCPRCRHTNRVSVEQLRRASPRPLAGTSQPAETPQPDEAGGEETSEIGEEPAKG